MVLGFLFSRQLSTEQAALQESLEKESKVNKRLSMENEELLWKLHNGDLCSPKRSPTSSAIPFQSPRNSGSFSSPSISPRWRFLNSGESLKAPSEMCGSAGRTLSWEEELNSLSGISTGELESSHHPIGYLRVGSSGGWLFNLVQKPPPKIDFFFWNWCGRSCTKHLRTREPCSFAFLHLSIRGNSQGPIKKKIYNLYNILHQRHLLVIFFSSLTVGGGMCDRNGCAGVSRDCHSPLCCVLKVNGWLWLVLY